jgi:MinD-like ATPase involved in chromosome partitioning or flagellar assembly
MLVTCWSVKGGSGCSLVAAALGLTLARLGHEVLLVDLGGDLPAVLGLPEPDQPGLSEWLSAGADVPADGLARLEIEAAPGLALIPGGGRPIAEVVGRGDRLRVLAGLLATAGRPVIVDAGLVGAGAPGLPLVAEARHALLVTRPCFLALRRLTASPGRPTGVVLVVEPGRALGRSDVEEVAGAPVLAEVAFDPAVARAVDAGLLASRLPRVLERSLRPVVR